MRIESGTTTEHKVRLGIFLAMCVVFAAYFGYDGLWGYPAKNLHVAQQNITDVSPEEKADIKTNPKVLMSELSALKETVESGEPLSEQELRDRLGEPAVVADPVDDTPGKYFWYVGPAAFARINVDDGRVREVYRFENINKSESDIYMQKVLGVILGIVSLVVGAQYIRIMTMKTVLDDSGVKVKGRHVEWDAMKELDTTDYNRKGWVDLVYQRNGEADSVRLDSYHIAEFDRIVETICERKSFECPIKPKSDDPVDQEEQV